MRDIVTLACAKCKRRNYSTTKNKKKHQDRISYKKFCRWCNSHQEHKETR